MLYLVRHAKAGSRSAWVGDDRTRPLTPGGLRQAAALAQRLRHVDVPAVISSPYVRCVQTVEPIAVQRSLRVEVHAALVEGRSFVPVLELLTAVADGTVLCSHGDVIPDTIAALERRGCTIHGVPDWRKGSIWVIERSAGECVGAEAWPPPGD